MAKVSGRGVQLFCSVFIVIGLVAVGAGIWTLVKSLRSEHWPVTDGVMQSAKVKSHSGSKGGTTYSAEVTYAYQAAGTNYTGGKVSIGQMSSSSDYAWGIVNRYPAGKKVSVYYSPDDAADAVLETGIHGGTWICFGVGTAFTLFGILFLQISRAAARAELPGAPPSGIRPQPDGSVTMDKPPVLMGVIFLLVGIGLSFVTPDNGTPRWIMWAIGAMFSFGGLLLLLYRLEDKTYAKFATWLVVAMWLAVFHWVSFGAGERHGTVSGPFFVSHLVNVRTPFAIFTILIDLAIVAGLIHWLFKKPAEETSPDRFPGEPVPPDNKSKLKLVVGLVLLALVAIFFAFHKTPSPVLPPSTEAPFVSTPIDDAFWLKLVHRHSERYRKQLAAAPPVLVVRETHYDFNSANGTAMHYGWIDGRLVNLHITFSVLVADAYGQDYAHIQFPEAWTNGQWTNRYDVICTVTNQPRETLQAAEKKFLRQQYGLAWHTAARNTDVLVLRAKDPQLLQTKVTSDFARSKSIHEFTRELENYFGRPVIDETGATNRYDKAIGEVPARSVNGRSTDLDFNNQFLATVGLELVAANRPQEWLLLDQ